MPDIPLLIPHVDDVACSLSANRSILRLLPIGVVTCGSVMVPSGWFPHYAKASSGLDLDMGVHLTLTSESASFRWRPVSTRDPGTGLLDSTGHFWPTVRELRAHADPIAVDIELRAQLDQALAAGIDITHLDHHMGAAVVPEFVENTVQMAIDHRLPILLPSDINGYFAVLETGPVDMTVLEFQRNRLADVRLAVGDTFLMGLTFKDEPNPRETFLRLLSNLGPGTTYLSLHCSTTGDIEQVHPNNASWRIDEDRLFSDSTFARWLHHQPIDIAGMRRFRDAART